eukprot:7844563-Pyramimonas_sp.AAC.1
MHTKRQRNNRSCNPTTQQISNISDRLRCKKYTLAVRLRWRRNRFHHWVLGFRGLVVGVYGQGIDHSTTTDGEIGSTPFR